jgi:hypothetical protein
MQTFRSSDDKSEREKVKEMPGPALRRQFYILESVVENVS